MNIYIDFDGTLFDTDLFFDDFLLLCQKYGISKEKVKKEKTHMKGLFSLEKLVKLLIEKYDLKDDFSAEVEKLYNPSYLYKDSISFLEKYYKKYNIIILTKGDYNYQTRKIDCCNFKKYFKKIIITKDKSLEKIDYQNSVFIDNNPFDLYKYKLNGASKLIRIKHQDDHYSKIVTKDFKEYLSLTDIDVL